MDTARTPARFRCTHSAIAPSSNSLRGGAVSARGGRGGAYGGGGG